MKISKEPNDLWTWRHTMAILLIWIAVHVLGKAFEDYLHNNTELRKIELEVPVTEQRNRLLETQNKALSEHLESLGQQNILLWRLLDKNGKPI